MDDPDLVHCLVTLFADDLPPKRSTANSLPLGIRKRKFSTDGLRPGSLVLQSRPALGGTDPPNSAVS
jgi:hypothetical protein